jgi:NAD(P)-dependent dehydrogenase (short-subunit alcohol dehydrogenase family)
MPDKIAMITGASGGLGNAVASALHQKGWHLALVTRDLKKLSQDAAAAKACLIEADVSSTSGAEKAIAQCVANTGHAPSVLVNCAGSVLMSPLHKTRENQYRHCMQANVDTSFFSLGAFINGCMDHNQPGVAVLVSSVAARIGVSNHEAVAASKAAVEGLARSVAATYSRDNIRVNAVAPGLMRSPATEWLFTTPKNARQLDAQYPLGRHGQVEDVANTIAWLVSDEASWITGQVFPVDGGFTAVRPLQRAG